MIVGPEPGLVQMLVRWTSNMLFPRNLYQNAALFPALWATRVADFPDGKVFG